MYRRNARQPFLGLLKVSLLGVAFPLLLTSHNWAQANTKQESSVLYAQTPAQSKPQPSKPADSKKINLPPQEKKQQEGEKSDEDKQQDLPCTVTVATLAVVVVLYLGILRFYPLLLLRLPAELKVPKTPITPAEFKFPLGFVIWLKYRPRVLDAWVQKHIDTFEKKFLKNETVDERKDYVSLPVEFNKQEIEELTAIDLRKTFETEKRVRLLIWGEGGSGKTTIACQIAKWAIEKNDSKRLSKHLMLPVLIEQELKLQSGEGIKPLIEEIVGQIQELSDGEQKIVDELLVEQLLRQRRILLIVDHFSEMGQQTREQINPDFREFPANALVITSRIEEKFNGIDTKIKTLRFDGGKLAYFIEQYLKQCDKWELFEWDQEDFLQECAQLARIVGDKKTITVLLAKLYAERMINAKENASLTERSLDNIPDLIIEHLSKLNRDVERRTAEEYHTLEPDAKLIAWKCLEQNYKPSYVERTSVIDALGKEKADNALEHFEKKLFLIKSGKSGTIRFVLDPLAEYLAGLYLVNHLNENDISWRDFLAKVDNNPDKQEANKGFLLALRECCISKGAEAKVPSFVAEEIGKLAGLNLEALKQEQIKRRIRLLVANLSAPEANAGDKQRAAEELGKIGLPAKSAAPAVIKALKDKDSKVRFTAVQTLSNLGNNSEPVLQALLFMLTNQDAQIRSKAGKALGRLSKDSQTVLQALLALLTNQNSHVRSTAAEVLGKLGNTSEPVLQALLVLLTDTDNNSHVRSTAAEVLGKLGNTSEPVLQALLVLLTDNNSHVRGIAAKVLGKLGKNSEPVLQGLLARFQDENFNVCCYAIEALGNLGNLSELVVQEPPEPLTDITVEDDSVVIVNIHNILLDTHSTQALGKLASTSEPVLQALLMLLKHENFIMRAKAAQALGYLEYKAEPAIEALQSLLGDKNNDVIVCVAKALAQLDSAPFKPSHFNNNVIAKNH